MTNLNPKRPSLAPALLAGCVAVAALAWSGLSLSAAREAADVARAALADSRASAERILAARGKGAAAGGNPEDRDARAAVARAAEEAGVELQSIEEQAPRRLGTSGLVEYPTRLRAEDVMMPDLITFLHALVEASPDRVVSELRLTSPRDPGATEGWAAEATLTSVAAAPRDADRPREAGPPTRR